MFVGDGPGNLLITEVSFVTIHNYFCRLQALYQLADGEKEEKNNIMRLHQMQKALLVPDDSLLGFVTSKILLVLKNVTFFI